jgi:hypothetical protein
MRRDIKRYGNDEGWEEINYIRSISVGPYVNYNVTGKRFLGVMKM